MNTTKRLLIVAALLSCSAAGLGCQRTPATSSAAPPHPHETAETGLDSAIRVRRPADLVQSGVTKPELELQAFGLASADDIAARLVPALSVTDDSGRNLSVQTTSTLDDDGIAHIHIAVPGPAAPKRWYYFTVSASPDVRLDDGDGSWTVSLYTGDLVYVQQVVQPAGNDKQDTVFLRFSQPVSYDARWSTQVLADDNGTALAGCTQINGTCATTGTWTARDVQIRLPHGQGPRVHRLLPKALGMRPGGPALGIAAAAATMRRNPTDGSLPLGFEPCHHGGARCASL